MVTKNKRAIRRHHRARLIGKYKHYEICKSFSDGDNVKQRDFRVRKWVNNISVCSCMMCCNPRHNGWASNKLKKTLQELRNEINFQEQMEDT